ncbi:MAG: hypothetical protein Q4C46_10200 [Bacillota bacterium]|nr:hypothetical protein [Bacillota bacterium]
MKKETIKSKEITRYSLPLIWIAAMRDRGKNDGPMLTDYLNKQLTSFLSAENEKMMSLIQEREMLISRIKAAISFRKKTDQERTAVDLSYIQQLEKEIEQIKAVYSKRKECATQIIEQKILAYRRYREGGTR